MDTILRAIAAYLFLVFVVRVMGRRPGAQMTPYEFVLIFFIGGIMIQAVVGDDHSMTGGVVAVMTVAMMHVAMGWLKQRYARFGAVIDGTPLVLLSHGHWDSRVLQKMRVQDNDVMAAAREQGLTSLDEIKYAILERNGAISIVKNQQE